MLGGIASVPDDLILAEAYVQAASCLVEAASAGAARILPGEYWVSLSDLQGFFSELFHFIREAHRDLMKAMI